MLRMRHIFRFLQLTLIILAFVVVYNGHLLGVLLLPFLTLECIFKNSVKNRAAVLVVVLFVLQLFALMSFYFGTSTINESGNNSLQKMIRASDGLIRQSPLFSARRESHVVTNKERVPSLRKLDSVHYDRVAAYISECTNFSDSSYDAKHDMPQINPDAMSYLTQTVGEIPLSNFSDLKHWTSGEVKTRLARVFSELPSEGFLPEYRNPCWMGNSETIEEVNKHNKERKRRQKRSKGIPVPAEDGEDGVHPALSCLPYAYILGQPKSGTTDLFQRMSGHPSIYPPLRKEIRWLTRGEFVTNVRDIDILDEQTSIYEFTSSFSDSLRGIQKHAATAITIDGGPHTFWWPTQGADGSLRPQDVPPPQILREVQPHAKFIITLADPVRRMYSDYYFLDDDRKVARGGGKSDHKSPLIFHQRAEQQVNDFRTCVDKRLVATAADNNSSTAGGLLAIPNEDSSEVRLGPWFRAAQECAHDRHQFGLAGYGRLSIGLYVLYLEKWLEHFDPSQFLVVRLEDYSANPKGYMTKVFAFLGLDIPNEQDTAVWDKILGHDPFNQHKVDREPMLSLTDKMLRDFHRPYNVLLSKMLKNRNFLWDDYESIAAANEKVKQAAKERFANELHEPNEIASDKVSNTVPQKERKWQKYNPHGLGHEHKDDDDDKDTPLTGGGNKPSRPHLPVPPREERSITRSGPAPTFLRGRKQEATRSVDPTAPLDYRPRSFSLDGLPRADSPGAFNKFLLRVIQPNEWVDEKNASNPLCAAALGMDYAALEHLLYDLGVPPDTGEGLNTPLHCLGSTHIFSDAVSKSYVFNMLKGKPSWITDLLDPPLEMPVRSIRSQDIRDSLAQRVNGTLQWFVRAGANVNAANVDGHTPLHFAAFSGQMVLVEELLRHGADPDILNKQKKSPLHYAIVVGFVQIAALLVKHGADIHAVDIHGVSPMDIISNTGVISGDDAMKYFGVEQNRVRRIERVIHPELDPKQWPGDGGFGPERLQGFEDDMECAVDQYWAHEISAKDVFEKYLARLRPILIRGLINDWPALDRYKVSNLLESHGLDMVQASSIPYSVKFGGDGTESTLLKDYIFNMRNHSIVGGQYPWYVFVGTPLARRFQPDSLVHIDVVPTPPLVAEALHYLNMGPNYNYDGSNPYDEQLVSSRKDFINAQWALGGEGTGAPVHFHNTAWNALVYGAKKWLLYPPSEMIMSSRQIKDFVEHDMNEFVARGIKPTTCVQVAGDVMIVPEMWGHGILNLQESVAVATESKGSMWRVRAQLPVMKLLPDDNRAKPRDATFDAKTEQEIALSHVAKKASQLDRQLAGDKD